MSALLKIKQAGFEIQIANNGNLLINPFSKLSQLQIDFLKQHKTQIISELKLQQAANGLNYEHRIAILRWLTFIGENSIEIISEVLNNCQQDRDCLEYFLKRATEAPFDDRYYCAMCENLFKGKCLVQQFRPLDDLPRRCPDFAMKE